MGRKKIYADEELRERRRAQQRVANARRHYTPEQRAANAAKQREYRANQTAMQVGKTHALLGGAERTATKPRGFIDAWHPLPKTEALLEQVKAILEEYREHLPLTIRQIFYRLVGVYSFEKTHLAYVRLCDVLNRARRARIIDMDVIRDDGSTVITPFSYESTQDFIDTVRHWAAHMRLDRTAGQEPRLVVMCEAIGMAPQLGTVCDPYGISVMASGGFDSLTEKYKFAEQLSEGEATEVLHIGDHDPSGAHMFLALMEDVQAFCEPLGGDVEFTRLAVTPRQIEQMSLPTAPKKPGGPAFRGETCQAEAIAPDDLASILRDAIEERLDRKAYEKVLRAEGKARRDLKPRLDGM